MKTGSLISYDRGDVFTPIPFFLCFLHCDNYNTTYVQCSDAANVTKMHNKHARHSLMYMGSKMVIKVTKWEHCHKTDPSLKKIQCSK